MLLQPHLALLVLEEELLLLEEQLLLLLLLRSLQEMLQGGLVAGTRIQEGLRGGRELGRGCSGRAWGWRRG